MLVIAPYKSLHDLFLEVNKELNMDMDVVVGNLYRGVEIANSLKTRGYDVIISRGATAKVIREQSTIPVIDLSISGYDILRCLTLVQGYTGKIGVMSFLNVVRGADVIGALMGMNFTSFTINEEEEAEQKIRQAQRENYQVIIGDVLSARAAERYGMNGILITSGREAVLEAIDRAEQIVSYTNEERQKRKRFQSALQISSEGVVIVNQQGQCVGMNSTAEDLLDLKTTDIYNKTLNGIIPYLSFEKVIEKRHKEVYHHVNVNGNTISINKFPIFEGEKLIGATAILLKRTTGAIPWSDDSRGRSAEERSPYVHFNQLVANGENMKILIECAKRISNSCIPVVIYGERGTGKNNLAQAMHNGSKRKDKPFFFIDCRKYAADVLEMELFGYGFGEHLNSFLHRANGGTICINAVNKMSVHLQKRLLDVMRNHSLKKSKENQEINVRFIFLLEKKLDHQVKNATFREDLFKEMNGFTLSLPPLRNRKEDIEDLICLFIASMNAKIKKQIVGLHKEVLEKLRTYQWVGNITQLKMIIQQMCFLSEGPFIQEEEVYSVMKNLQETSEEIKQFSTNLSNKNLEDIQIEIIQTILKEENGNHSKTAERLGINRTTLWRKLKISKVM